LTPGVRLRVKNIHSSICQPLWQFHSHESPCNLECSFVFLISSVFTVYNFSLHLHLHVHYTRIFANPRTVEWQKDTKLIKITLQYQYQYQFISVHPIQKGVMTHRI
jgi:hypothetical protein